MPCNGACPDDMMLCDAGYGSPEPNHMCFAEVEFLFMNRAAFVDFAQNDGNATELGFHYCNGNCNLLSQPCDVMILSISPEYMPKVVI